ASAGLLPRPHRTRLDSELDLNGCAGRSRRRRGQPRPRRQRTVAATLNSRSAAARRDRGVDLIASTPLRTPQRLLLKCRGYFDETSACGGAGQICTARIAAPATTATVVT